MTNILDRVAAERCSFRPRTAQEFFALQLARRLNDIASVHSYAALVENHSEELLLNVYRNTLDKGRTEDMAKRFRLELQRCTVRRAYEK